MSFIDKLKEKYRKYPEEYRDLLRMYRSRLERLAEIYLSAFVGALSIDSIVVVLGFVLKWYREATAMFVVAIVVVTAILVAVAYYAARYGRLIMELYELELGDSMNKRASEPSVMKLAIFVIALTWAAVIFAILFLP